MTAPTWSTVPKAQPGDRVAVLSPAFAAPAVSAAVHEQAMRRLRDCTGLEPVEHPTTRLRAVQRDTVIEQVARYNPDAVVCVGVPFGHTRPQWIVPFGGTVRLDGAVRTVTADYA